MEYLLANRDLAIEIEGRRSPSCSTPRLAPEDIESNLNRLGRFGPVSRLPVQPCLTWESCCSSAPCSLVARPLRHRPIQRAGRPAQPHRRVLEQRGHRAQAPVRPDPEPRRDRQGLRGPRARGARARHRTARPLRGEPRPGRRPGPGRDRSWWTRSSAAGAWSRTTRSSRPTSTSSNSSANWSTPRTASRPRAGSTTATCATTGTSARRSPATSWRGFHFPPAEFFSVPPAVRDVPDVQFGAT